jgi:pimeloyl-ACP methyl ester carboxylesterase
MFRTTDLSARTEDSPRRDCQFSNFSASPTISFHLPRISRHASPHGHHVGNSLLTNLQLCIKAKMPYITVNNHRLHYFNSWDPTTQSTTPSLSIVLIHGLGSSQNYYFPILPYLKEYRCITFDTYGSGRSKYDGQEHSVQTIAKDVLSLMDALHIKQAVVVGHSMGGIVVNFLASTVPERVLAVICIGPVHPNPSVAPFFEKRIQVVQKGTPSLLYVLI